jgi:hypothetical protein
MTWESKSQAIGQVAGQVAIQILRFCEQPRKASEIQALVGVKHRQTFRENYLNALIAKGCLSVRLPTNQEVGCSVTGPQREGKSGRKTAPTTAQLCKSRRHIHAK